MKCLLLVPQFPENTYWNYREVCGLYGKRYPAAPLGMITVAALLPQDWDLRLVDLNVRELDPALLDWADIVLTGGMLPQQKALRALIEFCQRRGKRVAVGGQDPTSQPHLYAAADYLVLDEGEMTVPMFLADLAAGARGGVYRSAEKPDVTLSPTPRFDLLELSMYMHVGVQFSRGCPFNCEFCDIIELYGRKPRTKTSAQVLRELDALYRLGYRGHIDFVDDNFIGNKKSVMAFLPELLEWSRARKFPFYFSTEATINLADDPRLLAMMQAVDFRYVFIGIETPDRDLLIATQKKQNTRHPIVDSVRRIQEHGIIVTAGFIVGFDGESRAAANTIVSCVDAAAIPMAMVSLLVALPNTQLSRRLAREGRLFEEAFVQRPDDVDQYTSGLNFIPTRPVDEILEDYASALRQVYSPAGYFGRVRRLAQTLRHSPKQRGSTRGGLHKEIVALFGLIRRLGFARETAWLFWRTVFQILLRHRRSIEPALELIALYIHFRKQTRFALTVLDQRIARFRAGHHDARVAPLEELAGHQGSG